jgi:hypothetical protein
MWDIEIYEYMFWVICSGQAWFLNVHDFENVIWIVWKEQSFSSIVADILFRFLLKSPLRGSFCLFIIHIWNLSWTSSITVGSGIVGCKYEDCSIVFINVFYGCFSLRLYKKQTKLGSKYSWFAHLNPCTLWNCSCWFILDFWSFLNYSEKFQNINISIPCYISDELSWQYSVMYLFLKCPSRSRLWIDWDLCRSSFFWIGWHKCGSCWATTSMLLCQGMCI